MRFCLFALIIIMARPVFAVPLVCSKLFAQGPEVQGRKSKSQLIQIKQEAQAAVAALKQAPNFDTFTFWQLENVINKVIATPVGAISDVDGSSLIIYKLLISAAQRDGFDQKKYAKEIQILEKFVDTIKPQTSFPELIIYFENKLPVAEELKARVINLLGSVRLAEQPQVPNALKNEFTEVYSLLKEQKSSKAVRQLVEVLSQLKAPPDIQTLADLNKLDLEEAVSYLRETQPVEEFSKKSLTPKQQSFLETAFKKAIEDVSNEWIDGILEGDVKLTSKSKISEVEPLSLDGKLYGWVVTVSAKATEAKKNKVVSSKRLITAKFQVERVDLSDFEASVD